MSKFTTEIRFICESLYDMKPSGASNVDKVVENVHKKIFDFPYPIFDTAYKSILETKILKHFYTREISEETFGLWKLRLNTKMNEIMPYFNKFYLSEKMKLEPFKTHDLNRTYKKEGDTNDKTTSQGLTNSLAATNTSSNAQTVTNDEQKNRYSDTPQGGLSDVENDRYLTNATIDNRDATVNSTKGDYSNTNGNVTTQESSNKKIESIEDYIESVTGFEGINQSELLMKYRDSFINVDMMVIQSLEPLFFQMW